MVRIPTAGTLVAGLRQYPEAPPPMYDRARYYHPGLQRLISEATFAFRAGNPKLYSYVRNSPTNFSDPVGLQHPMAAEACAMGMASGAVDEFNRNGVKTTEAG